MKMHRAATQAEQQLMQLLSQLLAARHACLAQPQDAQALHALRVAMRALRSMLRPWLRSDSPERLRLALACWQQLIRESNPLREADVQAELLRSLLPPDHAGLAPALQWLNAIELDRQRQAWLAQLGQPRAEAALWLVRNGARALLHGQGADFEPRLRRQQARLAARILARLQHPRRTLAEARDWHALRLDCKRLRYLLESYPQLPDALRLARLAKAAQGALGLLNDLDGLMARLDAQPGGLGALADHLLPAREAARSVALPTLRALRQALPAR